MHSLHFSRLILFLGRSSIISAKSPKSSTNRKSILNNLIFPHLPIHRCILQYIRRNIALVHTFVKPRRMRSTKIGHNSHKWSNTSFTTRRTIGIKRTKNLKWKILTQRMHTHDHIGSLIILGAIKWIPRQTLLERLEACQFQHEVIQPQSKRRRSKFIEPLPQETVLRHDFVQSHVFIVGEEWTVVRINVHDIAMDFQWEAIRFGLVKDIKGIAKSVGGGTMSTACV
mmetsp:Transcript_15730/g.22367  ORF Transcript_15730/g.22367 Transcript_15730/m.22367 type:complete len:227 (-) Transcript_15730:234-914(-)